MKKLMTFALLLLLPLSAFSAISISSIKCVNKSGVDKSSGLIYNPGDQFDVKIVYTADAETEVVLVAQSKNSVSGTNWSGDMFWSTTTFTLPAATAQEIVKTITVPTELTEETKLQLDGFRIMLSTDVSNPWGTNVKSAPDPNDDNKTSNVLAFGDIVEAQAPSDLALTSITFDEGSVSNREVTENTTVDVHLTYSTTADETAYAVVCYKNAWGTVVANVEMTLLASETEKTVAVPVREYTGTTADTLRIIIGKTATAAFGDRLVKPEGSTAKDVLYGSSIKASDLEVSTFTWSDDETKDTVIVENGTASFKVGYTTSADETIYAVLTYKDEDSWGSVEGNEELTLLASETSVSGSFELREYSATVADANRFRIILSKTSNAVWGSRIDVAGNEDANDDAVYADLKEDVTVGNVEISETATKVYPNPTTGEFTIALEEQAAITITDLSGKVVLTIAGAQGQNDVDLTALGSGVYLVAVQTETEVAVTKLLVE